MKKNAKYLISILFTTVLMLSMAVFAFALSEQDSYGTWEYTVNSDGTVTIDSFTMANPGKKNVVVPSTLGGNTVTKLGDGLFQGRSDVTSVTVPFGVKQIGNNVFDGCSRLETVILPNSLKVIGDNAFSNCANLKELSVPDSVDTLGNNLFTGSTNVNVLCTSSSTMATYIANHPSEVKNYSLLQVPATIKAPYTPASAPQTTGKLVTYHFGKRVGTDYEYTLVLADKNPTLNLNTYVVAGNTYAHVADGLHDIMNQRFSVISYQHRDFDTGTVYTGTAGLSDVYPFMQNPTDIVYMVGLDNGLTVIMNASNEVTGYREADGQHNGSHHPYKDSVVLSNANYLTELCKDINGNLLSSHITLSLNSHIVNTNPSDIQSKYPHLMWMPLCYSLGLSRQVSTDSNGVVTTTFQKTAQNFIEHNGTIYNASYKVTTNSANNRVIKTGTETVTTNGKPTNTSVPCPVNTLMVVVYDNNVKTSTFIKRVGQNYSSPALLGTYSVSTGHLYNSTWNYQQTDNNGTNQKVYSGTATSTGEIYCACLNVKASSIDEAQSVSEATLVNGFGSVLRDNADTHKDYVSDKEILVVDSRSYNGTCTDATGTTTPYTASEKYTTLEDHTYVGSTGKYVGWDWTWNYTKNAGSDTAEITNTVQHYSVSQYDYDPTSDYWVKTIVTANLINSSSTTTTDFNQVVPADLNQVLSEYTLYTTRYVYDDSVATGADNWLRLDSLSVFPGSGSDVFEIYVDNSANPVTVTDATNGKVTNTTSTSPVSTLETTIKDEESNAVDILLGNTTVDDGSGNTISQSTEKDAMITMEDAVKTELNNADPEGYYNSLESYIEGQQPDAVADITSAYSNDTIPSDQPVSASFSHEHQSNGTILTTP